MSGPALISSRLFWKSLEDALFLLASISHSEQVDDKNLFASIDGSIATKLPLCMARMLFLLSSGQDFFLEADLIYLLCLIFWGLLCFPDSPFFTFLLSKRTNQVFEKLKTYNWNIKIQAEKRCICLLLLLQLNLPLLFSESFEDTGICRSGHPMNCLRSAHWQNSLSVTAQLTLVDAHHCKNTCNLIILKHRTQNPTSVLPFLVSCCGLGSSGLLVIRRSTVNFFL